MGRREVKKITLGFIASWILGILFILYGAAIISESIAFGSLIIILSAMIIPYFDKIILDKFNFKISGGIKFVLVLAILALIGLSESPSGTVLVNSTGGVVNTSQDVTASNLSIVSQGNIDNLECPNVVGTTSFEFTWGESVSGNRHLYLYADFLKRISFSDGWTLDNLPSSGLIRDSFVCERGSRAGENVNMLYCRPTLDYQPRIKRNFADSQGNIVRTDYLYVTTFIFDVTNKDINNVNDLSSVNLVGITCSETSWW